MIDQHDGITAQEIIPFEKQDEFLSLKGRHNLLISGYGFGKSETLMFALILDMQMYGQYSPVFAVYNPTYDLLNLNTLPRLLSRFDQLGISYDYNAQKKKIFTSHGDIILRSMDTPRRIVAYECFRSYFDELETLRKEQIEDVWKKALGRNRQVLAGCEEAVNRTYTFTTGDQGFGFTYKKWGCAKGKDRLEYQYVIGSTRDNPHIKLDYIESLELDYSEEEAEVFIDGIWGNLKSGVVYSEFNRKEIHGTVNLTGLDNLLIGQDFNVGGCVSIIAKQHQGVLYILKTMVTNKTYDIAERFKGMYSNTATVYPDSSGSNGSSNATETDIEILEKDFEVIYPDSNPRVAQRVLSLNSALRKGLIKFDTNEPSVLDLVEALEQQAYDKHGRPEKFTGSATIDDYNDATGYLNFAINPVERKTPQVIQRPRSLR